MRRSVTTARASRFCWRTSLLGGRVGKRMDVPSGRRRRPSKALVDSTPHDGMIPRSVRSTFLCRSPKSAPPSWQILPRTATDQFVARYGGELDADDVLTLRSVAEVLFAWQVNHPEPFSLVHGDYRLDNLMLDPAGRDIVVVDWQTLTVALPGRDLGYFIGTSFPTEQRREQEGQLVATYYGELRAQGVEGYTLDRCSADYRIGLLHGPMITVIGSMTSTGTRGGPADEMFLSMARRSCAAVRDHHTN